MDFEDSQPLPTPGPALPLDVVDLIMTCLVPSSEFPVRKPDLAACSLVCKDWRELSIPHLFRSITYSFTHWPAGLPDHLKLLPIDSDKSWITPHGGIYDIAYDMKLRGAGVRFPAHCFVALFKFFEHHPDYCRSIRSMKLIGRKCPHFRAQWEHKSFPSFRAPTLVDESLFMVTMRLFPNLQKLSLARLMLDDTQQSTPLTIPSTTQFLRTSLTSLSVDFTGSFGRPARRHPFGHVDDPDTELTKVMHCFKGIRSLTVSNYASHNCHVLDPSFEPTLHLHSLILDGPTNLTCRALLNYPNVSNLRSLSASMYPMSPDVLKDWERLLRNIGPQLDYLECELRYDGHWRVSWGSDVTLPYLSACPNLSSLNFTLLSTSFVDSGKRYPALDVLKAMYTSYISGTSHPRLRYASVTCLEDSWKEPWGRFADGLDVIGRAMLELSNRVEDLSIEFIVEDMEWSQYLLDNVSSFDQLSQRVCAPVIVDQAFGAIRANDLY